MNLIHGAVGLPGLTPLPWSQMLAIFVCAMVSYLFVNDAVRVVMMKWRVPAEVAKHAGRSKSAVETPDLVAQVC